MSIFGGNQVTPTTISTTTPESPIEPTDNEAAPPLQQNTETKDSPTLSDKKQLKESKRDNDRLKLENDKLKEKIDGAAEVTPDLEAGLLTTTTTNNSAPAPRKSIKEQVSIAKLETEKLQAENKKLKDNPQRRKSSTLLAPLTYQRPMKTL